MTRDARERGLTIRVGVTPPQGADLFEVVDALEELGYDSIWLSDSATRPGLAAIPALAAIAARTERLKLGSSVLALPPRNPVLLAKELATIDALSGGRMLPAGGLGVEAPVERAALGVPKGEHVARLEESVHVIKLLWPGERVSFEGRFCTLDDVKLDPRPVRTKLEVWLGGRAPAALERIGRIADGWLAAFVTPDELALGADRIRKAAAAAGRGIDEDHYGTTIFCAEDADTAERVAGRLRKLRPDVDLPSSLAVGTDACRELLDRFVAAGASKFVVVPVARETRAFLRALYDEAVAPVEARVWS